jgi:hypothetical protein
MATWRREIQAVSESTKKFIEDSNIGSRQTSPPPPSSQGESAQALEACSVASTMMTWRREIRAVSESGNQLIEDANAC